MNNDDLLLLLMYVCHITIKVRHERRSDREMSDIFCKNPMTDHCEKKDLTTPTRERYIDNATQELVESSYQYYFICQLD